MNYKYVNEEKKRYTMIDAKDGMLITPSGYDCPSIVLGGDMEDFGCSEIDPELLLAGEIVEHTLYHYLAVFCIADNTVYYLHKDIPINILDYEIIIKRDE